MFAKMIRATVITLLALSLGCVSLGSTPRERAASATNLTLGAPFYAVTYVSGFFLNVIAYGTAWIAGEQKQTPLWLSTDYGPTYASVNTPWCWLYAGAEPEGRQIAGPIHRGAPLHQDIPLRRMHTEWPPAFAFCRTNVGILWNARGDESFPLVK